LGNTGQTLSTQDGKTTKIILGLGLVMIYPRENLIAQQCNAGGRNRGELEGRRLENHSIISLIHRRRKNDRHRRWGVGAEDQKGVVEIPQIGESGMGGVKIGVLIQFEMLPLDLLGAGDVSEGEVEGGGPMGRGHDGERLT